VRSVIFVADGTAANDDLHNATLLDLQYYFAHGVLTDQVLRFLPPAPDLIIPERLDGVDDIGTGRIAQRAEQRLQVVHGTAT